MHNMRNTIKRMLSFFLSAVVVASMLWGISIPAAANPSASIGRDAIADAVDTNAAAFAASIQAAAASGHRYTGYHGMMDDWAQREVGMAHTLRLMPDTVMDFFLEPIERGHFADLIYQAILRSTGMTEAWLNDSVYRQSFPDAASMAVQVCAGLDIITGYTDGTFKPANRITRQEAAAMLSRLAEVMGARGSGTVINYTDISGLWGAREISNVSTLRDGYTGNAVMGGVGSNQFSPHSTYSRQQAVATIVRIVGATAGTYAGPPPPPAAQQQGITLNAELVGMIGRTNAYLRQVNGNNCDVYIDYGTPTANYTRFSVTYPVAFIFTYTDAFEDIHRNLGSERYPIDRNIFPDDSIIHALGVIYYPNYENNLHHMFITNLPLTFENMNASFTLEGSLNFKEDDEWEIDSWGFDTWNCRFIAGEYSISAQFREQGGQRVLFQANVTRR